MLKHDEVLRLALLEMARRPHLTGGDDLISVRVTAVGSPVVCWDVFLSYASAGTYKVSLGYYGENGFVENVLNSLLPSE